MGLLFITAVYWWVLRGDSAWIQEHGLSLGGLLEPQKATRHRDALTRFYHESRSSLLPVLFLSAIVFPPYALLYSWWWGGLGAFRIQAVWLVAEDIPGQLLGVALSEEFFFRGYLQSSLDKIYGTPIKILGAEVGLGLLISSAIFAAGHFLTIPVIGRLSVFFPSLLFGWLRARTGGVAAPILFHAMCNLFASGIAHGYGWRN